MPTINQTTSPVLRLEDRTLAFSKAIRKFVGVIPYSRVTNSDCEQLIRSSGSVGANYIEGKDAVSRKDFLFRIRICRKEATESLYWLRSIEEHLSAEVHEAFAKLTNECDQLIRIFTAIAKTTEKNNRIASGK